MAQVRITAGLPTECPACHGIGYTKESAAEMHYEDHPEHGPVERFTVYRDMVPQIGSGCLKCGGTGQLCRLEDRGGEKQC